MIMISSQMKMQRPSGCGQKWQMGQLLPEGCTAGSVAAGTVSGAAVPPPWLMSFVPKAMIWE